LEYCSFALSTLEYGGRKFTRPRVIPLGNLILMAIAKAFIVKTPSVLGLKNKPT